MYLGKIRNSGQIADKPKLRQKEKPTKGFVKPNVSCAYGDPYGNRKSNLIFSLLPLTCRKPFVHAGLRRFTIFTVLRYSGLLV